MGAGKKVYTYVSFSSQNNSSFMGLKILKIISTIEFFKNKVVLKVVLFWNEGVGCRWSENGHFRWSA